MQRSTVVFDAQEIVKGVWLGSATAAMNKNILQQKNIKYALTVARDMVEFEPASTTTSSWFLEHAALELFDTEDDLLLGNLDEALKFVDVCLFDPRGGSILVHCMAGVSRSASVVIAYLMTRKDMRFHQALSMVSDIREVAAPNDGFMDQLIMLERCKHDYKAALHAYQNGLDESDDD